MIDRWIVDSTPSTRYPIYTRANVGEVFPDPVAPLSGDLITRGAEPGWRDSLDRFGAFDHDEFASDNNEVIGIFGGYCYLNVSVTRILGVRTPGLSPEMIDYQLWGEQPGVPPYAALPTDESAPHTERIMQTLGWVLTTDTLPELAAADQMLDELRDTRPDLTQLSELELVDRVRTLFGERYRDLFAQHLFTTYCSTVPVGIIQQVCEAVGRPGDMLKLLAGVGDVESAAPSYAMWALSRMETGSDEFKVAFADFLNDYGARGPNEWEMRSPTWETEPELALVAIEQMRRAPADASPVEHQSARSDERERVGADIAAMLEGDPETQGQFLAALRAAPLFLAGRERSKTNAIRLTHEFRLALLELGRRYVERGFFDRANSYGMVRWDELDQLIDDPASLTKTLRQREHDYAELATVEPPFVFEGSPPPVSEWPLRGGRPVSVANTGDTLQGVPGCPGISRGGPGSCSTRTTRPRSSPATCSSHRSPIRRGRRCSCRPPASSSTWVRR